MSLQSFIDKYTGKFVEYHSYNPAAINQCTDLANQYITEVLGLPAIIGTNAQDFPSKRGENYDWIANTPTGEPIPGDLMIFKSADGVGHISILVKCINLGLFTSFDQNYPTGSPCKLVNHSYTNVLGWLRPRKDTMLADEIAVKKTDFENLVYKSSQLDTILAKYDVANAEALFSKVSGMASRITDLGNQLGKAQAEVKNKEEIISRLQKNILEQEDQINTLMGRLDSAGNTIVQLGKDKGALAIQVEQLKVQVETLKQGTITSTSTIQQLVDWFKGLFFKN